MSKRGRKTKAVISEDPIKPVIFSDENEMTSDVKSEAKSEVIIKSETISEAKSEATVSATTESETTESETTLKNAVTESETIEIEECVPKKRGRKPKGGKIVQQLAPLSNANDAKTNVILHLKCSLKDLATNTMDQSPVESFNFASEKNTSFYEIISSNVVEKKPVEPEKEEEEVVNAPTTDIKDVWRKLKVLEHNLHMNNINNKKSACFWCTCEFDNPPVYIPKHHIKDSYHVYGCFCSPECATAHLMEENIDSSSKFERYQLINHIYSKIYNYEKNIKPAPNPYYMLDKYYGNLSIQEYRALLRNERLFLVVDKPLTRILPELHEDNDDFIINNKIIPSNTYQIKRKIQKTQTKNTIVSETFGMN